MAWFDCDMRSDPSSSRWPTSEGANWRALRLSLVFLLDVIEISRGDGDIIDTVLINAISTASVARVSGDSDLDAHFATIEAPPPDEVRRAVSVNALAQSLHLPFETVRRRVGRLVRAGLLEIRPAGVVQSAAAVMDPTYLAQAVARYERLRRFYFDLVAARALRHVGADPTTAAFDGPPVRIGNRAMAEYCLRALDRFVTVAANPLNAVIFMEVARSSAAHLDGALFEASAPWSESDRKPVTPLAVARRLSLPAETVRRHVLKLQEKGLVRRVAGGVAPVDAALNSAGVRKGASENAADLVRLFRRLDQLGVLAWWEAERAQTGRRRDRSGASRGA